ncbi:MAG: HPr family phosphocarrier protein [Gammaproteobacteria bacterium]|nr:HPr family phosphocarrier protein [Gammaproteobacteria bacterium]
MVSRRCKITNKLGLHARACVKLQNTARQFESPVILKKDEQAAAAASVLQLMMLAAGQGTELVIEAEGEDAEDALNAVEELIANRFEEGE